MDYNKHTVLINSMVIWTAVKRTFGIMQSSTLSAFEQQCGIEYAATQYNKLACEYLVIDDRKFQLARLKHGL